jgi:hypothetical protein
MGVNAPDIQGLSVESRHDDRMRILTFTQYSTEIVDAWADQIRAYRALQVGTTARFLVYDAIAIKNLTFDSYLRQRATELAEDDPEATGRVAIVVSVMPGARHIFQLFLWLVGRSTQPNLSVHIFDKRGAAIVWVEQACLAQKSS